MSLMTLLGIILLIAVAILAIFSNFSIKLNHLVFYIAAIIHGLILIIQGQNLNPILQFCQIILAIITIFYTFETVRLHRKKP